MKLEFSGSPEITAARVPVWARLMDPHFLARSAPGVESVEIIDTNRFTVVSGFGAGSFKVRFTMDVELFDIVPERSARMRMQAQAPGSAVEVLSRIEIQEADPNTVRLNWSATSEISGTVAGLGARLMEGAARRLTEQFWTDFARRVAAE
ncbi:MAG TPA: carbon monoxide dehydrogenase subunit G [Gemmatimonadales bacterium]|jgi:carbon monoxide dehydrogenase subunit G